MVTRSISVDPTENVKSLSEAANKRQDDLRDALGILQVARNETLTARVDAAERIMQIRKEHSDEIGSLIKQHGDEMSAAHAANDRAMHAADQDTMNELRTSITTGIESLRSALGVTAARIESANLERFNQLSERLRELERSYSEAKGAERVSDPMMSTLIVEVKKLSESKAGISMTTIVIVGAIGLIASVSGIFSTFTHAPAPAQSQQPQVYYVPAAPGTLIPSPSAPVQPAR